MKIAFRALVIVLILCLVCTCLTACSDSGSKDKEVKSEISEKTRTKVDELNQQIETNISLRTYKNNIALYETLIELQPGNIDWHVGLADTYRMLGNSSKYMRVSKDIIKLFKEDKTGHLMLIKYYAEKGRDKRVISTFNEAPSNVQSDKEFLAVYQKSEWIYKVRGNRSDFIGQYGSKRYVYEKNGLYGYKKSDLYSSISAKFTVARPFIEEYAAVNKDNEWYFIDTSGYRVIATNEPIEDLYSFSENYAVAKIDGKYGYIDTSFNKYHFDYEDATNFYNGVAAVKQGNKWALIDKDFNLLTSFEYDGIVRDDANVCSREGIVFCRYNGAYHMVNAKGEEVIDDTFANARLFYSKYAAVQRGGKWGFVDTWGNVVIDFIYEDASSFASEIAVVKQGGKWGCVTLEGKVVLPFNYEDARITSDTGVVAIKIDDYYKFAQFIKFTV